jgi:hypothetical protein
VITAIVNLKQCDDDIDGFSVFNLEEAITKITANASNETIVFFKTIADAQSNINLISNTTSYTNTVVSNDVVYVRVTNANACFRIAKLNLIVSTTKIPLAFLKTFTQWMIQLQGLIQMVFLRLILAALTIRFRLFFLRGNFWILLITETRTML